MSCGAAVDAVAKTDELVKSTERENAHVQMAEALQALLSVAGSIKKVRRYCVGGGGWVPVSEHN